jgi:N-acetylmuramoyl-L-alanine amidase
MRYLSVLFIFILSQSLFGTANIDLTRIWPQLNNRAIVDDLNLKIRVPGRFQIMDNSRWCIVNGKTIKLKDPNRYVDGIWKVSPEFVHEVRSHGWLKQLPRKIRLPTTQGPLIVLDAGHGGKDSGAVGLGGLREKDVVLDITKRVHIMLRDKKVRVHMIRSTDVFVDLHERCKISNEKNATIFISIHCNSHPNRDIHGYQLYRMDPRITHKNRADWGRKRFNLSKHAPTDAKGLKKKFNSFEKLFQWKDKESLILSKRMNEHFHYRKTDITIQPQKNLCVLRETFAPSILVETDFISNFAGEASMSDPRWREKVARDITAGILSYLGLGPKS